MLIPFLGESADGECGPVHERIRACPFSTYIVKMRELQDVVTDGRNNVGGTEHVVFSAVEEPKVIACCDGAETYVSW